MTMQTDVKQSRLTQTGWIVQGPSRLKGTSLRSNGSAVGRVFLFDTDTTPVTATYGQSTTTVTITKTAHGLNTGDTVSIGDRKSTRLNSSHIPLSRMPSSA